MPCTSNCADGEDGTGVGVVQDRNAAQAQTWPPSVPHQLSQRLVQLQEPSKCCHDNACYATLSCSAAQPHSARRNGSGLLMPTGEVWEDVSAGQRCRAGWPLGVEVATHLHAGAMQTLTEASLSVALSLVAGNLIARGQAGPLAASALASWAEA